MKREEKMVEADTIEELVADLAYFMRDNQFLEMERRRDEFSRVRSKLTDYDLALTQARDIKERLDQATSELNEDKISHAYISGSNLEIVTKEHEERRVIIYGVQHWRNYGPIIRTDIGRETVEFFFDDGNVNFQEAREKLTKYVEHLEEKSQELQVKYDETYAALLESFTMTSYQEFEDRLNDFNARWQGIQVYSEANKIAINNITRPEFISEWVNDFSALDKESEISNAFRTSCYLTYGIVEIADALISAFLEGEEKGVVRVTLVQKIPREEGSPIVNPFVRESISFGRSNQMSYCNVENILGIYNPDMIEIEREMRYDTDMTEEEYRRESENKPFARLCVEKEQPDYIQDVQLINYCGDFELFAQNIRMIGNFFRKNQSDSER